MGSQWKNASGRIIGMHGSLEVKGSDFQSKSPRHEFSDTSAEPGEIKDFMCKDHHPDVIRKGIEKYKAGS